MQRDMDLVRNLLLKIEAEAIEPYACLQGIKIENYDNDSINYNLDLMLQNQLITGEVKPYDDGALHLINGITWNGHDFLDSIREPDVWARTKAGASQVKDWSFETFKALAKGFARKKIEELTGVQLP